MYAEDSGFSDHLAHQLGMSVDLVAVRAAGATAARTALYRRGRQDPSYIIGKRVLIWLFAARELTESTGWELVPVRAPINT